MSPDQEMACEPVVTVYITNYNYAEYIEQAIESVLSQTFRRYEILIIDDGSTDGSRDIIKRYIGRPNVRVIFQQNKGLNASSNIAVRAAHGKYVMRLDADDYLDENAMLVMVNKMESESDLALVFSDYYYVDKNGNVTGQERRHDFKDGVTLLDQPAHGACTLVRRDCLLEVGSYNTAFTCQDGWDLWLKMTERFKVGNVNLPLFYYRHHGKNLTTDSERILRTRAEILKAHAENVTPRQFRCIAVLPVRGRAVDPSSQVESILGGRKLVNWTIDEVLKVSQIEEVIVTTPDDELSSYLKETYGDALILCHRDPQDALENTSFDQAVIQALDFRQTTFTPDAIVDLTVDTPFRSSFYIEKAINTMRVHGVDVVLGVMPEDDMFYHHDGTGLKPIGNNSHVSELRLEREYIYRQSGGLTVMKWGHFVEKKGLLDGQVGHCVLTQRAAMRVRNTFEFRMACAALDENER